MKSVPQWSVNLSAAATMAGEAAERGAELIALPEVCLSRGAKPGASRGESGGPLRLDAVSLNDAGLGEFQAIARDFATTILLGSVLEQSEDPDKPYNTSILIGPSGVVASYRKVHLFDIDAGDGAADKESDRYAAGDEVVLAQTPWGKLGLTICYDLRFPELYRRLALDGAQLVTVPANFTKKTGEAHWATLLRARAIENAMFILAPAQCGAPGSDDPSILGSFAAYGHSMVVDPWGRVLLEMDDQPGVGYCEIDLDEVQRVRAMIPSLANRRPGVYGL